MRAMLGVAEAVSFAALAGEVDPVDAENEIYDAIRRIVRRGWTSPRPLCCARGAFPALPQFGKVTPTSGLRRLAALRADSV